MKVSIVDIKKVLKLIFGVIFYVVTCMVYTTIGYYFYNAMTLIVLAIIGIGIIKVCDNCFIGFKNKENSTELMILTAYQMSIELFLSYHLGYIALVSRHAIKLVVFLMIIVAITIVMSNAISHHMGHIKCLLLAVVMIGVYIFEFFVFHSITFVVLGLIPFLFVFAAFNDAFEEWKENHEK